MTGDAISMGPRQGGAQPAKARRLVRGGLDGVLRCALGYGPRSGSLGAREPIRGLGPVGCRPIIGGLSHGER